MSRGVSANLCDALVRIIKPFPTLDVGVSWARTRPVATQGTVVRFGQADAALLREAANSLRERAPRPDVRLHGFVRLLKRGEAEDDGTIRLATDIDRRGSNRSLRFLVGRTMTGRFRLTRTAHWSCWRVTSNVPASGGGCSIRTSMASCVTTSRSRATLRMTMGRHPEHGPIPRSDHGC